jgi:putative RecB family exonuclease
VPRLASTDGVELDVQHLGGDGPPLLLAHATGFCGAVLGPLARRLTGSFSCWTFDARGHGATVTPPGLDWSWGRFAADVLAVVDGLGVDWPLFGFGHSSGGAALLDAEAGRPGTFAALWCYEPIVWPAVTDALVASREPLIAGALKRRDHFTSRQEAFENFASKPPLASLDPEVLQAYVDCGFEADGAGVRLRCRPAVEAEIYREGLVHDGFARLARAGRRQRRRRAGGGRGPGTSAARGPPCYLRRPRPLRPPRTPRRRRRRRRHRLRHRLRPGLSHPRFCRTPSVPLTSMALPLPTSLSPSKVASFKDCALAFRFSAIDRLPEPPSPSATKGTLVHRALELLFCEPAESRTVPTALACLDRARAEMTTDPEFVGLGLDVEEAAQFGADAEILLRRYFELEDPRTVHPIGLELRLQVQVGSLMLRGIIDRLELDADGGLVVTDYKSGKVPGITHEQSRLGGVHFYAFLCERVLGRRPSRIQLLYLSEPVAIVAEPSDQSIRGLEQRTSAIWKAVERACANEDFRPHPSPLCNWCSFQDYCPAFGGDPSRARALVGTGVTS